MNFESQELLSDLRVRLLSLCAQFRHAENELVKTDLQEQMGAVLRAIAHEEAHIKNERSRAESDSSF
jgi:hypothetical protein